MAQHNQGSSTRPELHLVNQILDGAREQLRNGQVDDAVSLLQNAVELITGGPTTVTHQTASQVREVAALVASGASFWRNWGALVSPDAGLYTPAGALAEVRSGAHHVALRA